MDERAEHGAGGEREIVAEAALDPSEVDAEELARNIATVSDEQLREGMSSELRGQILDEIFRRMETHFRSDAAADTEAVIHWRIGGAPGGGHDEYETVISGGACSVRPGLSAAQPRVAFTIDGVDFLRLVTGNVAGPSLFMSGRLRIEGDLMFAASAASLFTIPKGA